MTLDTIALLATVVECPICNEIRRFTHIFQCKNGHNICAVCKANIDLCPQCRCMYDFPPRRNRTVEELIATGNFVFKCRHEGCEFKAPNEKLKRHESKCARRLEFCPMKCGNTMMPELVPEHLGTFHVPCESAPTCPFNGTKRDLVKHRKDCRCRLVPCPSGICSFKIRAFEILEHIDESHPETKKRSCFNGVMEEGWLLRRDMSLSTNWALAVNEFDGQLFIPR